MRGGVAILHRAILLIDHVLLRSTLEDVNADQAPWTHMQLDPGLTADQSRCSSSKKAIGAAQPEKKEEEEDSQPPRAPTHCVLPCSYDVLLSSE